MKAKIYKEACGMCAKPIFWFNNTPRDKGTRISHFQTCPFVSEKRKKLEKERERIIHA